MLFPAVWSALKSWPVDNRFADGEHVTVSTFAVMAHLSLAWSGWTRLPWMALRLASMLTLRPRFHAALATALFEELLNTVVALSFRVTESETNVSAPERDPTSLATAWGSLVAEGLLVLVLAAGTSLGDWFETRRTGSEMASQGAFVAAREDLLARAAASWRDLAASHGRVDLGDAARAVEWLPRVDLAGLAFAEMAEVTARV